MTRTARVCVAARAPTKQPTKAPSYKGAHEDTDETAKCPRHSAFLLRSRYVLATCLLPCPGGGAACSSMLAVCEYAASGGRPPSRLERGVGAVTRTARVCVAAKAPTKQPTKAPSTKARQRLRKAPERRRGSGGG